MALIQDIVCPVSNEKLNKRASRVGATLTAILLVAFFVTGWWPILAVVLLDYIVRVFTNQTAPIGVIAGGTLRALQVSAEPMDKAPKVFAWRVGFTMAVAAAAALPFSDNVSRYIAIALAAFNVLDGVGNLCVGCIMYTYLILPRMRPDATVG